MGIKVFKRGQSFSLYVPTSSGALVQRSTGTRSKEVAKKIADFVAELRNDRVFDLLNAVASKQTTLDELYQAKINNSLGVLRSKLNAARITDYVEPWLDTHRAAGMSPESISLYRQRIVKILNPPGLPPVEFTYELEEGKILDLLSMLHVTPGTARQYLNMLVSLCRYLVAKKVLAYNTAANRDLVPLPRKNNPRRKWVTADVDQLIVATVDFGYQAAVAFAHATGADRGDIARLRCRDIDFARQTVDIMGTKSRARRRFGVPIEAWALPYLEDACRGLKPDQRPFAHLSGDAVSRAHERATEKLELDDYQLRDGRHSYAIRAILSGAHIKDVSRWLGHSNMWTTYSTYVHFDGEVKRKLDGQV